MDLLLPQIKSWFDSALGHELLMAEQALIEQLLPDIFGVHLVQILVDGRVKLFKTSTVTHCFSIIPALELGMEESNIVADNTEIPLGHETVDVVILHHALDFTSSPHQVLREVSRILRPGGHIIILGFNPTSLWGMIRLFKRCKPLLPWVGHFISHRRLSDWFKLLHLTELKWLSGYYKLPIESSKWRARFSFLNQLAAYIPGHRGAFSICLARKDMAGMTPIRPGWDLKRLISSVPVIEPSTRTTSGRIHEKN